MKIVVILCSFCCIVSTNNQSDKGGVESYLAPRALQAKPTEFPYHVSIQNERFHLCGGALISTKHVLTAAHCLNQAIAQANLYVVSKLTVEVGSIRIGRGKTHEIRRLAIAYGFDLENTQYINPNDIGIAQLREPVKLSPNVQIIHLPQPGLEIPINTRVIVTGFGNDKLGNPTSPDLKKSEMYIIPLNECNKYYEDNWARSILPSQICAKLGLGSGTCQGDSGSPLIYNKQVVAVVSAGDGKCGAGNPDVYTKVMPFLPFIQYELNFNFNDAPSGIQSLSTPLNVDNLPKSSDNLPNPLIQYHEPPKEYPQPPEVYSDKIQKQKPQIVYPWPPAATIWPRNSKIDFKLIFKELAEVKL